MSAEEPVYQCTINLTHAEYLALQKLFSTRRRQTGDKARSFGDRVHDALIALIVAHNDITHKDEKEYPYLCSECFERFRASEISYCIKPLFGPKEYICMTCHNNRPPIF